jgi:hypothetical protein
MLYVTIVDAEKRSTRSRHKTDDPGKAVAEATGKYLKGAELRDTTVLGVVVEKHRKAISEASISEALTEVASAEAERHAED